MSILILRISAPLPSLAISKDPLFFFFFFPPSANLFLILSLLFVTNISNDFRYNNPPLNKNLIWGEIITSDPEGGCTKKVLKWFDQNNLTAVNEIQARYKCFSQPKVGKVFAP